jgi:hypothetical protein
MRLRVEKRAFRSGNKKNRELGMYSYDLVFFPPFFLFFKD